jgi:AbrB family looped-hinge helix DNA binding protein
MTLVKIRRATQITLPRDIREAARLEEGDYLEAEVTESGAILLKPVSIAGREPTPNRKPRFWLPSTKPDASMPISVFDVSVLVSAFFPKAFPAGF